MAEIWGAIIVGGAALGGAYLSSQGAKKAGNAAAASSDAAIAEQRRQFDIIRGDTADSRAVGNQALNALGSIYGYVPASQYFPTQQNTFGGGGSGVGYYDPSSSPSFGQTGLGNALQYDNFLRPITNPAGDAVLRTADLFGIDLGKHSAFLDPIGFGLGSLFGSKKGDEKRNLKAFTSEVPLRDLGDGMLQLPDGTVFPQSALEEIAGTWYGAVYAPDGDQQGWQQKFDDVLSRHRASPWNAGRQQASGPVTVDQQGNPVAPAPMDRADYRNFFASPDYQFRLDEGMNAVQNSAAAQGGLYSGNALRAVTEYGQGLAAGEFGNWFNRQAALAGIGQTATGQSAQAGLATGANVGNALMAAGNARASGIAGSANAWGDALGGAAQLYGWWDANRRFPRG